MSLKRNALIDLRHTLQFLLLATAPENTKAGIRILTLAERHDERIKPFLRL